MIQKGYKSNFETLKRAAENGDLALVECADAVTGEPVITVCAMSYEGNGDISMAPIAKMFNGNPYEELLPPTLGEEEKALPRVNYTFETREARLSMHNGKTCAIVETLPYTGGDHMFIVCMETGEKFGALGRELTDIK